MAIELAVLSASGEDRPGIMDELSQFLLECGGNITDTRSVNLGGRFALLMLIRAESQAMHAIRAGLHRLAEASIQAELHPANGRGQRVQDAFPFVFTATGADQAGVVHRISHLLRVLNINIDDIETHVYADATFRLRMDLAVPRETPISMLKDYLSYLCQELHISGELKQK
jgi:glycine cleavage system transcriptional repressor